VGDYSVTYVEPTSGIDADRAGTGAPITLGGVFAVRKGEESFTVQPSRNYYPSGDAGPIRRFFEGEATSEVDVRWGLARDFWVAVQPDLAELEEPIAEAERRFAGSSPDVQGIAIAAIVERYRNRPVPVAVRVLVSPLVAWIWIGGGIVLAGALIALWPAAEARRRALAGAYAARVGRDLSRA
jgi:cytochrome c-type biogenesis protein CcmF